MAASLNPFSAMVLVEHKKRLTPKSGLLVRKYRKGIRLSFAGLIILLTTIFLFYNTNAGVNLPSIRLRNTARFSEDYLIPFTDKEQHVIHPTDDGKKVRAAMVTLTRNKDLYQLVNAIRDVEDRFNYRYHYDWVFLNDEPFTDEFKRVTTALVSGRTKYGTIPKEHWSLPSWIDQEKMQAGIERMKDMRIPYFNSVPYRHMCRYQSGFFWQSPLLDEYEYYWRVDHDVKIYCDIQYDIFKFMKVNGKKYGFILSVSEYIGTIPTLWDTVMKFTKENPKYLAEDNLMKFVSDDGGKTFNLCHFWTNFEVVSLDFYRSEAYRSYFDYLDKSGGFFYERWGDAPVHSIAAALFLKKSEVHFFDGLGFYHPDFHACPVEEAIRLQNKCTCDPSLDETWLPYYFCTRKFFEAQGYKLPPEIM